ncbi:MAG: hypothetical protein R3344_05765 [Acidobacteriota bacterium]|nr:hypothetical protein [Acidobacteriota bacterium]
MSRLQDDLRLLRDIDDDALLGHVHAQHLVAHVEGRLDDRISGYVDEHLRHCLVCRDAAEVLRKTLESEDAEPAPDADDRTGGLGGLLRRTLMAPVPVAAVVLLVAVLGVWWATRPQPGTDTTVFSSPLPLFSDDTLRGGETAPDPIRVAWPEGSGFAVLLHTEIAPADLTGPLSIRVEQDGEPVLAEELFPDRLAPDGAIIVVLPMETRSKDALYRVTVEAPGALPFSASFRIDPAL